MLTIQHPDAFKYSLKGKERKKTYVSQNFVCNLVYEEAKDILVSSFHSSWATEAGHRYQGHFLWLEHRGIFKYM